MSTIAELAFDMDTRDLDSGRPKIRGARDDIDGLYSASDNAAKANKSFGSSFGAMAAAAAAAVGIGALASNVLEYNTQLKEVSTLIDPTIVSMDDMTDSIEAQAKKYGGNATSQAAAYYSAISAGATTVAAATATVDQANKLAIGGVSDIETAVDGLTSVVNAYGDAGDGLQSVSDTIFTAVRLGKTTVDELSSSVGKVAPIAATAGVSFDQLGAGIATLTAGGLATSESVTGLKALLSSILKPSEQAKKLADELGLSYDSTALKADGLAGFLAKVSEKTGGNIDKMTILAGGTEGLGAMLGLTAEDGKKFNEAIEEMGKKLGATDEAFEKISAGPGAELDRLFAAISTTALSLGNSFVNTITPAITVFADVATVVSDALMGLRDSFSEPLQVKNGILDIGPMMQVGLLALQGFVTVVDAVKTVWSDFMGSFDDIEIAPGIVTTSENMKTLQGIIDGAKDGLILFKDGVVLAFEAVNDLFEAMKPAEDSALGQIFRDVLEFITPAVPYLVAGGTALIAIGAAAATVGALAGAIGLVASAAGALGAALFLNPVTLAIAALAGGALLIYKNWDGIVEFWEGIMTSMDTSTEAVWSNIKDIFLKYTPVGLLYDNWSGISDWWSGLFDGIGDDTQSTWDKIKDIFANNTFDQLLKKGWDGVQKWWSGVWSNFTQPIKDKFTEMKNMFSSEFPNITGVMINTWNDLSAAVKTVWNGITKFVELGIKDIKAFFNKDDPTETFKKNFTVLSDFVGKVFENIKTTIKGALTIIDGILGNDFGKVLDGAKIILGGFKTFWVDMFNDMAGLPGKVVDMAKDAVQGFKNIFQKDAIDDEVTGFWGSILDKGKEILDINSPSKEMELLGNWTVLGLTKAIIAGAVKVSSAAEGMTIEILKPLEAESFYTSTKEAGVAVGENVAEGIRSGEPALAAATSVQVNTVENMATASVAATSTMSKETQQHYDDIVEAQTLRRISLEGGEQAVIDYKRSEADLSDEMVAQLRVQDDLLDAQEDLNELNKDADNLVFQLTKKQAILNAEIHGGADAGIRAALAFDGFIQEQIDLIAPMIANTERLQDQAEAIRDSGKAADESKSKLGEFFGEFAKGIAGIEIGELESKTERVGAVLNAGTNALGNIQDKNIQAQIKAERASGDYAEDELTATEQQMETRGTIGTYATVANAVVSPSSVNSWGGNEEKSAEYGEYGAVIGAAIGSIVPVIGTAIGAVLGGVIGNLVGGAFGGEKTLHEQGLQVNLNNQDGKLRGEDYQVIKQQGAFYQGSDYSTDFTQADAGVIAGLNNTWTKVTDNLQTQFKMMGQRSYRSITDGFGMASINIEGGEAFQESYANWIETTTNGAYSHAFARSAPHIRQMVMLQVGDVSTATVGEIRKGLQDVFAATQIMGPAFQMMGVNMGSTVRQSSHVIDGFSSVGKMMAQSEESAIKLATAFGGTEKAIEATQLIMSELAPQYVQTEFAMRNLEMGFTMFDEAVIAQGGSVIRTTDELYKYIQSQDASTVAGRENIVMAHAQIEAMKASTAIIEANKENMDVFSDAAITLGLSFNTGQENAQIFTNQLVEFSGGLGALENNLGSYYNNFFDAEERKDISNAKAIAAIDAYSTSLGLQGSSMDWTTEKFRAHIESLETLALAGDESAAKEYARALAISESMSIITKGEGDLATLRNAIPAEMIGKYQSFYDASVTAGESLYGTEESLNNITKASENQIKAGEASIITQHNARIEAEKSASATATATTAVADVATTMDGVTTAATNLDGGLVTTAENIDAVSTGVATTNVEHAALAGSLDTSNAATATATLTQGQFSISIDAANDSINTALVTVGDFNKAINNTTVAVSDVTAAALTMTARMMNAGASANDLNDAVGNLANAAGNAAGRVRDAASQMQAEIDNTRRANIEITNRTNSINDQAEKRLQDTNDILRKTQRDNARSNRESKRVLDSINARSAEQNRQIQNLQATTDRASRRAAG